MRDVLQSPGTVFRYLSGDAGETTGPAWTFPEAGSLRRGQIKRERWSHGYGLKSFCYHSLDVAVTRQRRADTGLSQLQHLLRDTPVLSFIREKQGNWKLSDFIIYMPVFQAVFSICKVSQTWIS